MDDANVPSLLCLTITSVVFKSWKSAFLFPHITSNQIIAVLDLVEPYLSNEYVG